MRSDAAYMTILETLTPDENQAELEKQMGFKYRPCIGELIFCMVTCRPDIAYAVIKLSQYSIQPGKAHYQAVKAVYTYLGSTITWGLQYNRPQPRTDLPFHLPDRCISNPQDRIIVEGIDEMEMFGMADSDWARDKHHRKSVTGIVLLLAGAAIAYKTKLQKSIALSSTEAEFVAASEAGKMILYIRSILQDIHLPPTRPTTLFEDNMGAMLLANAGHMSPRTRHIDIRYFALLDWCDHDYIKLEQIRTRHNAVDSMTKANGRLKFHSHMDFIMGKCHHDPSDDIRMWESRPTFDGGGVRIRSPTLHLPHSRYRYI